jgi:hypothetical protein
LKWETVILSESEQTFENITSFVLMASRDPETSLEVESWTDRPPKFEKSAQYDLVLIDEPETR